MAGKWLLWEVSAPYHKHPREYPCDLTASIIQKKWSNKAEASMGPSLRSHPLTLLQHFLPLDARTTGGYLGGWLPQSVMEWGLKECRWKWFYSTLYLQFNISALALYLLLSLQIYSSLSCPKKLTCMAYTKGFPCPLVSVKNPRRFRKEENRSINSFCSLPQSISLSQMSQFFSGKSLHSFQ